MIPYVDLGAGSYTEIGQAHGDAFGQGAAALFGVRWQLTRTRSGIKDVDALRALAHAHVNFLGDHSPGHLAEILGLASASGLEPWQLVILNHYTDFRDIRPDPSSVGDPAVVADPSDGGCSAIYAPLPSGPVIAQTWDMHGTAEPFVNLVRVAPPDGPPMVTFTLAGCLGMTGLNAAGVAVCINNLTPSDARVGLIWPALVRQMLLKTTAQGALDVLMQASLGSGHNYLIADPNQMFNVEATGGLKTQTATASNGGGEVVFHTNHYLDPALEAVQAPLHPKTTTHQRWDHLCRLLAETPDSIEALWGVMGSHEGYPKSICSHVAGDEPSAAKTCGGIICDVTARRVYAQRGCLHEAPWRMVEVS
ncbi:MAG: isopenicillin-N N-acyltransferase-like protein [Myxococcota bacterium]|jgi:isopenicillin-N N-acyltransferase-like protein